MKKILFLICFAALSAFGQGTSIRSNNGMGTNTSLFGTTTTKAINAGGNVLVTGALETQSTLDVGGGSVFVGDVLMQGGLNVGGTITGNGSGITQLDASDLSSGTVPTARLGSGTANSTTFLRGDQTWAAPSASETIPGATNIAFARWEKQAATSQTTNFNISVTNSLGRFMSHHIQIEAAADVMIHPDCYTNAVLALEVIASGGTRRVSFPTNIAQLNTTGLTLQSVGGTNWYVDVLQNCIFVASIKTNEYYGRRVMTWRTNVW